MKPEDKLYPLKTVHQAWGAGRMEALNQVEGQIEEEIDFRLSDKCQSCPIFEERDSLLEENNQLNTERNRLRIALKELVNDVQDDGFRVNQWIKDLL
jgi:hypothetical protein